jgi:hypothetical protein
MAELAVSLSDKALSVFMFAAYHELASGQKVTSVVRRDHAGHVADPDGVAELEHHGLVTRNGDFLQFSVEGERFLDALMSAIRQQVGR